MLHLLLLLVLAPGSSTLDVKQLEGLRSLLKNLPNGVFPTCSIALYSDMVDFDTADARCRAISLGGVSEAGNLATVSDETKNADLTLLLEMAYPNSSLPASPWAPERWVWAGLRKVRNNNHTAARAYNRANWAWADGSAPMNYSMWMAGQPDQRSMEPGEEKCPEETQGRCFQNQMRINHKGQWDDTFKFMKHPYACDYRGKYILSSERKTWADAAEACSNAGLQLAFVRDAGEVEEMRKAIADFLGKDRFTERFHPRNWIWIGGTDVEQEGDWRWLNGSPNRTRIETGRWNIPWLKTVGNDDSRPGSGKPPKANGKGQDVLAINRNGGMDDSFAYRRRPFACQCPED